MSAENFENGQCPVRGEPMQTVTAATSASQELLARYTRAFKVVGMLNRDIRAGEEADRQPDNYHLHAAFRAAVLADCMGYSMYRLTPPARPFSNREWLAAVASREANEVLVWCWRSVHSFKFPSRSRLLQRLPGGHRNGPDEIVGWATRVRSSGLPPFARMSAVAPGHVLAIARDTSLPPPARRSILADAWEELLPGLDVSSLREWVGPSNRHVFVSLVLSAMEAYHPYHSVARRETWERGRCKP